MNTKRSTSVSLGREMDVLIQSFVDSGLYANASEVMRAGLRALETEALRGQLRQVLTERAHAASQLRHIAELLEQLGESQLGKKTKAMADQLDGPARELRRAAE